MYWEKCQINEFSLSIEKSQKTELSQFVKISGLETDTNKPYWVYISKGSFDKLRNGIPINTALLGYNLEIREFLISGIAPSKISMETSKKELAFSAFVTNAVADSVVFFAMAYLNNGGLSPTQIAGLRTKYSVGNYEDGLFTPDELKTSFVKQSAFFLNLYLYMNAYDRFANFASDLKARNRFREVFRRYADPKSLFKHYERRIFHKYLECDAMRSDYNEDENYFPNTGVFSEQHLVTKNKFYVLEMDYLRRIGMRLCKICDGISEKENYPAVQQNIISS